MNTIIIIGITFESLLLVVQLNRTIFTFLLLDMDVILFWDLSTGLPSPCGLQEALESAMNSGLWGHALFLASKMDNRSYTTVLNRWEKQSNEHTTAARVKVVLELQANVDVSLSLGAICFVSAVSRVCVLAMLVALGGSAFGPDCNKLLCRFPLNDIQTLIVSRG